MSERKRMPAMARATFVSLFALYDLTDSLEDDFKELIDQRTDGGWERFKEAQKILEELCHEIMDTIPVEQLKIIRYQCKNSNVRIAWKGALGTPHDGMWPMDLDDMMKLATVSIENTCLMCDKTAGAPCELRRILNDLPIDINDSGLIMNCRR